MPITAEDIEQFIQERWAHRNCSRCAENHWAIGDEDQFKGLIAVGDDDAAGIGQIAQKFLPSYWLVCNNCGHLEFIATKIVRKWREDKDNG